ncbi:ribonuclease H-like YkuK family protein [Patescibacteria group bacterium]|nr:ribonuclease H-like YkuK family protein [Patescibacteria group bacterium]MBU4023438.1 ribonuclease H-like YkuK family protein [Patescibacteria group bacterium]MBU4078459.1 ribonuclease H-like YkuK family protein [Patescibacteria group bacterium]
MEKTLCEGNFFNPTKGNISFNQMLDEIFSYIKEEPKYDYEIIVGCDSSSSEEPSFPIAIVVLRKGAGGRFFLKKVKYHKRKFYNLHERILEEVWLSCRLALELRDIINKRVNKMVSPLKYEFEYIHADVGSSGATKDMIREVVGLIKGNGFEAKIKPEAYVASIVADRFS